MTLHIRKESKESIENVWEGEAQVCTEFVSKLTNLESDWINLVSATVKVSQSNFFSAP